MGDLHGIIYAWKAYRNRIYWPLQTACGGKSKDAFTDLGFVQSYRFSELALEGKVHDADGPWTEKTADARRT